MPDWRSMYDRNYIAAFDLNGKDVTLEIEKVEGVTLTSQKGTNKKPVVRFKGAEKGFVLNKTNGRVISRLFGNDTAQWVGKSITLYPSTVEAGGETMDCIRVRPSVPK